MALQTAKFANELDRLASEIAELESRRQGILAHLSRMEKASLPVTARAIAASSAPAPARATPAAPAPRAEPQDVQRPAARRRIVPPLVTSPPPARAARRQQDALDLLAKLLADAEQQAAHETEPEPEPEFVPEPEFDGSRGDRFYRSATA